MTTTDPAPSPPASSPKLCPDCQTPLKADELAVCGDCADARSARHAEQLRAEKQTERVQKWLALCPPLYASTAWTQHPELSPVCRDVAESWWADARGIGLGLYGRTGLGKTRAMFSILRRHHFAGRQVLPLQSMDIEEAAANVFADDPLLRNGAHDTLRRARGAGILYLDDLGKEKMTERVAKEFHRLIEHRCRHRLPTLWTSEQSGDWLARRLGEAYGDGLIRRLREFTDIRCVNP